jgi:hypothetical protein
MGWLLLSVATDAGVRFSGSEYLYQPGSYIALDECKKLIPNLHRWEQLDYTEQQVPPEK